ncbi:MAG: hypothetical protein COU82_02140 [Candidatus Portnoybacteria bacterium CG10_big_fil_rev_8_21_14_0_10_38_18]|uniref:DUF6036 domain-containing protein n=1 Tax=Candidatus Portnoybacteria bacterium CG10_big_fil_rev_8_21_14_0_10_38_18 TaxID=1974813 RepID=A0A2M8KBZ4_9BACT|nr:MAG: hypothetical protein COU82_02140 [Candidatus Portnoybacteria bacterium CG10_big_fil_rev_8_21_14_0_10_38_18]
MEIINPEKLLLKVVKILSNLKIDYFITGGYAVSVWGRPRSTADIDIVIKIIEAKITLLTKALRKISKAGYIDEGIAKEAVKKKDEFNFIDSDTGLKVDFWVMKGDKLSQIEFSRKIEKKIDGQKVYFISPENLILSKLEWYKQTDSNRHLEDIQSILIISGKKLDFNYLKRGAKDLGSLEILDNILRGLAS